MNAEHLHDALSLLPDDLLEPVDQLRQKKKRIPWKPIAALAACACLVVGLWTLFPGGAKSADNAAGMAPEDGFSGLLDNITQESETCTFLPVTVLEVAEDRLTVLPGEYLTDVAQPITVLFDELETVPQLKKGQRIKLYCEEYPDNGKPLVPYRIEVIED